MKKATIICGPTASGKTNFAHQYALRNNGEVVNCDSMQVYSGLPVLTASPESALTNELPYHLYNFKNPSKDYSVAEYIKDAKKIIPAISSRNNLPVIVGGTGMYIDALVNGINEIPNIDSSVRQEIRARGAQIGTPELHEELTRLDPNTAAKLKSNDGQRIMRALEVYYQTGKPLSYFQSKNKIKPLPNYEFETILLMPSRELLYDMCNKRLKQMFEEGAIDEIRALLKKEIILGESIKKALGVPQITAYLKGDLTKKEALEIASAKTRQYAKRQTTWFTNQLFGQKTYHFSSLEEYHAITTN